jgi:hypothetical protein
MDGLHDFTKVLLGSCNKACLPSSDDAYEVTNTKVDEGTDIDTKQDYMPLDPTFPVIKANQDHKRKVTSNTITILLMITRITVQTIFYLQKC